MGRRVQFGLSCWDRATDEWRGTAEEYNNVIEEKRMGTGLESAGQAASSR
jgi:hypothetical protein